MQFKAETRIPFGPLKFLRAILCILALAYSSSYVTYVRITWAQIGRNHLDEFVISSQLEASWCMVDGNRHCTFSWRDNYENSCGKITRNVKTPESFISSSSIPPLSSCCSNKFEYSPPLPCHRWNRSHLRYRIYFPFLFAWNCIKKLEKDKKKNLWSLESLEDDAK